MPNARIATYRLQLGPNLDFKGARDVIPYLAQLGVSHLYLSPCLQAASGSQHGYDVVDPSRASSELGGDEGFVELCLAANAAGLAVMLDIVPNHMSIGTDENPWWQSVLENGPSSKYAAYFDVDWSASEERWPNQVLLPVLPDHYGRVLQRGDIRLEREGVAFSIVHDDRHFPVDISTLGGVLHQAARDAHSDVLAFLAASCERLPRASATKREVLHRRHQDIAAILALLSRTCDDDSEVADAIDRQIAKVNGEIEELDRLLQMQNYRLAGWHVARHDMGYRRFFDVASLAGLRIENTEVFDAIHQRAFEWVRAGLVDGLRVDHPDGLLEPRQYMQRLRAACPDAWIVVEKILGPHETIPADWPVDGTTGYDFLAWCDRLFVNRSARDQMTRSYLEFIGEERDLEEALFETRRSVLMDSVGGEIDRVTAMFLNLCERTWRFRDFSRAELRQAVVHFLAAMPVYRTYVSPSKSEASPSDRQAIEEAVQTAAAWSPEVNPELFEFLAAPMLGQQATGTELELVLRLQQLSAVTMAKGVEDTHFYRHNRLISLNEVGNGPENFGATPLDFHMYNLGVAERHPSTMLSASTHDTKRGEDTRARITALSWYPDEWKNAVDDWAAHNAPCWHGYKADRNLEYAIYQTLVATWPIDPERLLAAVEKSVREAKIYTTWARQDSAYEGAVEAFIREVLADGGFVKMLEEFQRSIIPTAQLSGLAATLLRMTAPGVPDIYQGCELWNLSLVDPDNRRPVDFSQCAALLAELADLEVDAILDRMNEGLPKLHVVSQALKLRRRRPECFTGAYASLNARGPEADHVVGYTRGQDVAVVVRTGPRVDGDETTVALPAGEWINCLTGEPISGGAQTLGSLLGRFPVALLEKQS